MIPKICMAILFTIAITALSQKPSSGKEIELMKALESITYSQSKDTNVEAKSSLLFFEKQMLMSTPVSDKELYLFFIDFLFLIVSVIIKTTKLPSI